MNKYREAIISLTLMLSFGLKVEYLENENISKCLKTLQELIDKTVPKKVVYEEGKNIYGGLVRICPTCKDKIVVSPQAKEYEHYCRFCGQALEWSEDE